VAGIWLCVWLSDLCVVCCLVIVTVWRCIALGVVVCLCLIVLTCCNCRGFSAVDILGFVSCVSEWRVCTDCGKRALELCRG